MYGVGQGGGQDYFRGPGGKEVLRGSRGQERRKSATRGTGSPTWECSLGLVGGGRFLGYYLRIRKTLALGSIQLLCSRP